MLGAAATRAAVIRQRAVLRRAAGRPPQQQQRRSMGGGSHFMQVSEQHTQWGEAFGVVCWLWVFHRARHDLPVLLGFRHAWEHGDHHGGGGGHDGDDHSDH